MDTHSRTSRSRRTRAAMPALALVAALLGGCGGPDPARPPGDARPTESTRPTGDAPAPEGGPDSARPPEVVGDAELVALLHGTEGGGEVTPVAASMEVAAERRAFLAPLSPGLADDVRSAVRRGVRVSEDEVHAAVVAIGCDPPTALRVARTPEGLAVTATLPKPGVQCFAPVTYVAVVTAPAE